jgi:hypothetical protein
METGAHASHAADGCFQQAAAFLVADRYLTIMGELGFVIDELSFFAGGPG